MSCDEIDDLLPGYAFGALEPGEEREVERHLATCDRHPQMADYGRVAGALAATVTPVAPPDNVKRRLMARVYEDLEPRTVARPWWQAPWSWAVAAVLAVLALGLGVRDYVVSSQLAAAPVQWQLQPATTGAQTSGTLVYLPKEHTATLVLRQLPPLPAGRVYQVWLIKGGSPQPAGVFQPAADASASVLIKDQPPAYDTVAVTQEPGPDGSPAPTTSPFISAALK